LSDSKSAAMYRSRQEGCSAEANDGGVLLLIKNIRELATLSVNFRALNGPTRAHCCLTDEQGQNATGTVVIGSATLRQQRIRGMPILQQKIQCLRYCTDSADGVRRQVSEWTDAVTFLTGSVIFDTNHLVAFHHLVWRVQERRCW
jgi:hypothetical protein